MQQSNSDVVIMLRNELVTIGIPPRPAVVASIENEMRSDAPNYGELEKIISIDVGLSASLLKIANSSFFGFSGNVRSVKEALQILGLNSVAAAITALSLRKAFAHVPNMERFWDSSARIAQLSGWLATQLTFPERKIKAEEAYTVGLFRDCGIPILMANYSDYIDILKAANSEEIKPFTEIENDEMGVDHAMIGAKLAKEWLLPSEFQTAIEFHHDRATIDGSVAHPASEAARYFIALSQLAEYLFQRLSGLNKTREWNKLGPLCSEVLAIEDSDIEALFKLAGEKGVHSEPVF
jgi:HD-like signal output (HDOD) protein